MDEYFQIDWSFIDKIGDNPFTAMWFFMANGGWIILIIFMIWALVKSWVVWRQNIYTAKKQFVVLALDIPRTHEQGPRAVENMFSYLAGGHQSNTWTEQWIVGRTQDNISCEIISIDGQIQFLIRTTRILRDLVEAAVYSQYPDAEITEVEDYARKVPINYPDEEMDAYGFELVPVKPDIYPLKTYTFFEDKVSMEFKDPISALLESFARLGPGEQAWFQMLIKPIDQKEFKKKGDLVVKKMTGQKVEPPRTILDKAVDFPLKTSGYVLEQLVGMGAGETKAKKEEFPAMFRITPGERLVIEAIENKMSKIVYLCKIRFMYIAKKQVMSKPRIVNPFIGAIKQFNTNNLQSLKPETKKVGVNGALWFFKAQRNNGRKKRLVMSYRNRSDWSGTKTFHMSTEELATLWHFPHSLQVKTPQLKKTESKRSEPPSNIPFV
ncbi:MAG: hypothetical protein ABIB04_02660 [Patescibacteria group bacterium]